MLPSNYSNKNVSVLIVYIMGLLLANSPQILMQNLNPKQRIIFLLFSLNLPETFYTIVITVFSISLILCLIVLLVVREKSYFIQIYQYIIGPIQIYLSSICLYRILYGNQQSSLLTQQRLEKIIYYGLSLMFASIFIILKPFMIKIKLKDSNFESINCIDPTYSILNSLGIVLSAIIPLFFQESLFLIELLILVVFKIIKTAVYSSRINYQQVIIEYCAFLGQIGSWVSLILVYLTQSFNLNCSLLMWLYLVFLLKSLINKNNSIIFIMQQKYKNSLIQFKQNIKLSIKLKDKNLKLLGQTKLIEGFSCIFNFFLYNKQTSDGWRNIKFSKKFQLIISQLITCLLYLQQPLIFKQCQPYQLNHCVSSNNTLDTGCLLNNDLIINFNIQQRMYSEQNQQNRWKQLWKILSMIPEIYFPENKQLRRHIIYNYPLFKISVNYQLMHLYYLNRVQNNKKNFIQQIIDHFDYSYLTQKILLEHQTCERNPNKLADIKQIIKWQMLYENGDMQESESVISYDKNLKYCLNYGNQDFKSGKFDQYYKQNQIEKSILKQFSKFIQIERVILDLIGQNVQNKNKNEIFQLLENKNQIKKEIQQIVDKMKPLNQFKNIVYRFMYQHYVCNVPYIALNNLKQKNLDEKMFRKNEQTLNGTLKSLALIHKENNQNFSTGEKQQNKMILFISGVRSLGKILHYCQKFKQNLEIQPCKIDLQPNNYNQKLSISDFMLPIWVEKHQQVIKLKNIQQQAKSHVGTKFHLISLKEKKIYQISFQMHYLIRNMDDLLYGLDIKFQVVDHLLIYKNNCKIFQNLIKFGKKSISNTLKQRKSTYCSQSQDNSQFIKEQQTIFGQKYMFFKIYKNKYLNPDKKSQLKKDKKYQRHPQQLDFSISQQQKVQQLQFSDEQQNKYEISAEKQMQNIIQERNTKFIQQIQIKQFVSKNLIFKDQLLLWTFIHWNIPPFLFVSSLILRYYINSTNQSQSLLFESKLDILKDFLIPQLNTLKTLYYLNETYNKYSPNDFIENQNLHLIMYDIKSNAFKLKNRINQFQKYLLLNPSNIEELILNKQAFILDSSFYYSALKFDVYYDRYIKQLGYNISLENPLQNKQKVYKNASISFKFISQQFFKQFRNRYHNYYSYSTNKSLLDEINLREIQNYNNLPTFIQILILSLQVISVIPAIIFIRTFLQLRKNIQKLVYDCVSFKKYQLTKFIKKTQQCQIILQSCRQNRPSQIMDKYMNYYQGENSRQQNRLSMPNSNLNKTHQNLIAKFQVPTLTSKSVIFKKYIHHILFFIFLVTLISILLYLIMINVINQVQLKKNYSQASNNVTKMIGLSNEISLEMMIALQNKIQTDKLKNHINDYMKFDKINMIKILQPNQVNSQKLMYENLCIFSTKQDFQICEHLSKQTQFIYSSSVSVILRQFKSFQLHLQQIKSQNEKTFSIIASQKIFHHLEKMYLSLSTLNSFSNHILQIGYKNYQQLQQSPQTYMNLILTEIVFIIILLNWYSYSQFYLKMKMYFQQIFSLCSMDQMKKTQAFKMYLNKAMMERVNHVSGQYRLLDQKLF